MVPRNRMERGKTEMKQEHKVHPCTQMDLPTLESISEKDYLIAKRSIKSITAYA